MARRLRLERMQALLQPTELHVQELRLCHLHAVAVLAFVASDAFRTCIWCASGGQVVALLREKINRSLARIGLNRMEITYDFVTPGDLEMEKMSMGTREVGQHCSGCSPAMEGVCMYTAVVWRLFGVEEHRDSSMVLSGIVKRPS